MEWLEVIGDAVALRSLVIVYGNVNDLFSCSPSQAPGIGSAHGKSVSLDLDSVVGLELERRRCQYVMLVTPHVGVWTLRHSMVESVKSAFEWTNPSTAVVANERATHELLRWKCAAKPPTELGFLRALADLPRERSSQFGIVLRNFGVDARPDDRAPLERLMAHIVSSHQDNPGRELPGPRIVLIYDRESLIPQTLSASSGLSRVCAVPLPSLKDRLTFLRDIGEFHSSRSTQPSMKELDHAAARLDGFSTRDMLALSELSREASLGLGESDFGHLYNRFTNAVRRNAWEEVSVQTIRESGAELRLSIAGQSEAIDAVVDKLVQARAGTSAMMGLGRRPRGVFFFAGPTGVGKTELSKAIARLIFGDESALVAFDMSEYSEEHSVSRLIGSPPGYVGYSEGGQLTQRMMERPFTVVLFDEIEKAHKRLLDKFLQILEEGRLTDGQGRTASFAESIIIFTSNLGATQATTIECHECGEVIAAKARRCRFCGVQQSVAPRVTTAVDEESLRPEHSTRHERQRGYVQAVREYFISRLARPEILNRIGEHNIVAFNDLRDPHDRLAVVEKMTDRCRKDFLREYRLELTFDAGACIWLQWNPEGIDRNGGRGVRNLIEKHVLAPLSSVLLFEKDKLRSNRVVVTAGRPADEVKSLIREGRIDECRLSLEWENHGQDISSR
jgi:hypothetical protein